LGWSTHKESLSLFLVVLGVCLHHTSNHRKRDILPNSIDPLFTLETHAKHNTNTIYWAREDWRGPISIMERVPEDPPHEVFTPTILPGLSNQEVLVLRYGHAFPEPEVVDVLPQNDPSVAYKIIKSEPVIDLGHHAPGWGHVFFGIQLQRAEDGHFEEPDPENDQYRVAIKRLNKAVVDNSLAQGNEENPYKEIHRMQTVGDGQHVLNCLDALEDATNGFLYIITRRCDTLLSINNGLDENSYRPIFRRMLDRLVQECLMIDVAGAGAKLLHKPHPSFHSSSKLGLPSREKYLSR
jgi:hypothetical protein